MQINLTLEIPEAKTIPELRRATLAILQAGSEYSLYDYQIINFKFGTFKESQKEKK